MNDSLNAPAAKGSAAPGEGINDLVIEADNLAEVCDRAARLLAENPWSTLFCIGDSAVVSLVDDEELREALREQKRRPYRLTFVDDMGMVMAINRTIQVYRRDLRDGSLRRINCPPAIGRALLSERRHIYPPIVAVIEHPVVMPDGTCLDRPGYCRYGLYLTFDAEAFAGVFAPKRPTLVDAQNALDDLRELLLDFPFQDELSVAVALAMLVTAVLRQTLTQAPMFGVSARSPGTGKTYLQRIACALGTGRDLAPMPLPPNGEEFNKVLLASLIGAEQVIAFDNVDGQIESSALCVALTAPEYKDRLLGKSETVTAPTRALFMANGNNLLVSGDLVRRTLVCWLDANTERPELRSFRGDPLADALEQRPRFIRAVLTLVRAYQLAGRPLATTLPSFGSFNEWSSQVREPLVWVGLPDVLEAVTRAAALDPRMIQLRAMVLALRAAFSDRIFTVGQLVTAIHPKRDDPALAVDLLGEEERRQLREAVEAVAERNGEISKRALGIWFAAYEGRIVRGDDDQGLKIGRAGAKGESGQPWQVVRVKLCG